MTDKNKIMNRKITILLGGLLRCASMGAQQVDWPEIQTEAKPCLLYTSDAADEL